MDTFADRIAGLSRERLALLALGLRDKLEQSENSKREPIAVIGLGCRFPGSSNPEAYWRLLAEGREAIGPIPPDRFDVDAYYDPSPVAPGKMYARHAGFVERINWFDPQFFGIAPREAVSMDPQQRLLLEVAWEALEDAGQAGRLAGSPTGVFVGISTYDYLQLSCRHGSLGQIDPYTGTGCSYSVASGRLSYILGLSGPNFPVDTACSSSLVTVHLACQSLRNQECRMALAGGVNALLAPDPFVYFCKVRALSPDGTCKTFDATANGYVRGEGCGIVVLKRLTDAVADGDRILAVIRGSAVNHDGRSSGLTVPNRLAQEAVLRQALVNAGLSPRDIDYVEAHGTGTPLGDPIELQALGAALGAGRNRSDPLLVGAVKTNIGHLEAAAGIAGLIKVILALQNRHLPPHLHFQQPNPYVPWRELPLEVVTALRRWPERDRPRRAGVSSFGFSGTNAHVIVEEATSAEAALFEAGSLRKAERPLHLLCLSAKEEESLRNLAAACARQLEAPDAPAVADAGFTVNAGRAHFSQRLAVTAANASEAAAALSAFSEGRSTPALAVGQVTTHTPPKVAFLFTGQGAQYAGMGRQLYDTQPAFRLALDRCDELLGPYLDQPLLSVLYPEPGVVSPIDETAYTQPALFALEYALAEMWRSWGVEPAWVLGHSVGQYVAACIAGVFSLEDGLKLIAARARLMQALPRTGGMAAVFASEAQVVEVLALLGDRLSIAAVNGPRNVVVSGDHAALQEVLAQLAGRGIASQPLKVSHAFHSPLLEPMLAEFGRIAATVTYHPPRLGLLCNVTGQLANAQETATPAYWQQHARRAVRFADNIRTLEQRGCGIFLELGPQPTLIDLARQTATDPGHAWLASLRKRAEDWPVLLDAVRQAYLRGVPLDWKGFDRDYPRRLVRLPTYPFRRQLYTHEQPAEPAPERNGHLKAPEPTATEPQTVRDWLYEVRWEAKLLPRARQSQPAAGTWLLLTDESGVGAALAQHLQAQGQHCLQVLAGSAFAAVGASSNGTRTPPMERISTNPIHENSSDPRHPRSIWSVNPLEPQDFDQLLDAVAPFAPEGLKGIIHLWSLDSNATGEPTLPALERAQQRGSAAALHLVQALQRRLGSGKTPALWLVTRGAQPVEPGVVPGLAQAPLWGFGQVLAVEQPRWRCAMVDLDPAAAAAGSAEQLGALLFADEVENQQALRGGLRRVARLVRRRDLAGRGQPTVRGDATYLITGGLGGLGLVVARWLVEHGARHVVLVGRRSPDSSLEALASLQQLGAEVHTRQADVARPDDVARVLADIAGRLPPLRGIIHAAGLFDVGLVEQLQWPRFNELLRPKVAGAWNLHEQTRDLKLDFLVLFSSMASVLPSPGQGHYAAANAFLDALAHHRRSSGLPALSINWGPWVALGMAEQLTGNLRRRWRSLGMPELETDGGLAALSDLLATDAAQASVMPIAWERLFNLYPPGLEPPLLTHMAQQERKQEPPSAEWLKLSEQVRKAPRAERDALLMRYVHQQVAGVLGLDPQQGIAPTAGFFELGMDSLMAVELRNRLQTDLGTTHAVPVTLVFDAPNIAALASYLRDRVLSLDEPAAEAVATPAVRRNEPLAVIGFACRLPGGVRDGDSFWRLLHDGVDAIREVPPERWDVAAYYDPNPETPGKMYTRHGGFLDGIDQFDATFFGISPREAVRMDPQQRLLLEVAWEALENAHCPADRLGGSPTGVFVGISGNDYVRLLAQTGDVAQIDAYLGVGNALSIAAGRLSHFLGLRGPCLAVDTACSSSLVAVHLACESLREGKARLALAGGVNLILAPEPNISLCKARMMAPDGRCKTFDAGADGYVRSEGCALVVLKRLSDAEADGDRILAVIRGTAINHDGRSSGLTVPSGIAQEELLRLALCDAGLQPRDIDYVESHGTGTPLGDPIEIRALGEALARGRPTERPLLVGALKSNIGHAESAAGVAGLLKVVLALQHGEVPANLHLRQPNPYIPWQEFPIEVPTERRPWPGRGPRRAGVSSFGFSGTNAHVIVEESRTEETRAPQEAGALTPERPQHLLCLSAKQPDALRKLAESVASRLRADGPLADICWSANVGRAHFGHRLAVVAASPTDAAAALEAHTAGRPAPGLAAGQFQAASPPRLAFLFSGQGSHYPGMGRQLFETQPVFRQTLERCAAILAPRIDRPLLEVLYGAPADNILLNQTGYAQPALFALEYALAELWRSWGVTPAAVMGHSVGEYVAACVAGALSLEDGLRLIAERARLMQALPADGAMAAVFADEERVAAAVTPHAAEVAIACLNGPRNTIISGRRTAVNAVLAELARTGVRSQFLNVSHAFHSPLLEPMLDEFEAAAGRVAYAQPRLGFVSNLTGQLSEGLSASYWRRHAREPVRFSQGMNTLAERGYEAFLEIGPGSTLLGLGRQCLPDDRLLWLPTLRQGAGDWEPILKSLQQLYLHGAAIDWKGFDQPYRRRWVDLPTYPFQKGRYWLDGAPRPATPSAPAVTQVAVVPVSQGHPLLGERLRSPVLKEIIYQKRFEPTAPAFLDEHRIYSMVVVPGACHLSMVLSALTQGDGQLPVRVENVAFPEAVILPDGESRLVQLVIAPEGETGSSFRVFSAAQEGAEWSLHASGLLPGLVPSRSPRPAVNSNGQAIVPAIADVQARCTETVVSGRLLYQLMNQLGLQLGFSFQWIDQVWRRPGEALAQLRLPRDAEEVAPYVLHPGLLDSCFQTIGATFASKELENSVYIPVNIEKLVVHGRPTGRLWNHARLRPGAVDGQMFVGDLTVFDETGTVVVEIHGLRVRRAPRTTLMRFAQRRLLDMVYSVRWLKEADRPVAAERPTGNWLVFADEGGLGAELAQLLRQRGGHCALVYAGTAFAAEGADTFRFDPRDPAQFEQLFRNVPTASSCRGVLFLWSSDAPKTAPTWEEFLEGQAGGCQAVLHMAQLFGKQRGQALPRLWLVTRGAQLLEDGDEVSLTHAPLWGLRKVLSLEQPALRPTCIDLASNPGATDAALLLDELLADDREDQIAFRDGQRLVARLVQGLTTGKSTIGGLTVPRSEPYRLMRSEQGTLADLHLEVVARQPPRSGEVEILVSATGLNFRDVLNALGVYPGDAGPLGGECAGTIVSVGDGVTGFAPGDRVLAIGAGTFSRFVTTDARMVAHLPEGLSLEEATTVPVTFVTAQLALHELAHMGPGDKVLIHAAAGGVGVAAVQLALRAGAEVFATAGSPAKRDFLHGLGVRHVFDSRSLSFADDVLHATDGRGVDIVLNSLAGDFIDRSFAVLAPRGRFIEIGKRDIWDAARVSAVRPDVTYHTVALDQLIVHEPQHVGALLRGVVDLITARQLRPLPLTVFPLEQAAGAFRHMARAQHIGKIVVSHPAAAGAEPNRPLVLAGGTYLITGGLGGLGLLTARWLVDQGAKHLVLLGRRPPSPQAEGQIAELQERGTTVRVCQADAARRDDLQRVLAEIEASGFPLRGIVHAAGLLDDGILVRQDWPRFVGVFAPKIAGALHLHELTRNLPLDLFVLYSSAASVLGFPSQGNYAAANAFLDAFAYHRRGLGLAAQSINWGPWAEVGMAANTSAVVQQQWTASGVGTIAPTKGLIALEMLVQENVVQAAVMPMEWPRLLERFPPGAEPPLLARIVTDLARAREPSREWLQFVQSLTEAPPAERKDMVVSHLQAQAARVLGLPAEQLPDPRTPLNELGFDSLMAVEWANQLGAAAGISIPVTLLFDYPTLDALADFVLRDVVKLEGAAPSPSRASPPPAQLPASTDSLLDAIEQLSEEEVDEHLSTGDIA